MNLQDSSPSTNSHSTLPRLPRLEIMTSRSGNQADPSKWGVETQKLKFTVTISKPKSLTSAMISTRLSLPQVEINRATPKV